jgi:hypothetical protein
LKVYDSQGRLKVVGFMGPPGSVGTQSVTCAELSATASVLQAAIDVVSNGLSNLTSIHDVLSNRVSANSATGGGGSVTSAEVQVASAAATSADAHAAAASAAATSADAHANTVSARVVSASAELASLIQIASAAATSADAHANAVSGRAASISAELASLVQIASAAATSVNARVTSVNAALSAVSARSSGVSTHGVQSIINALSARIDAATGGGGSVTSTEAQAISAQAASAINVVSARLVSASAELASLVQIASAAATSADAHANVASAAATSVDSRIASLSAAFASLSGRSAGNVSTHGLQSIINALSNRISAVTGGAGSVTSTELSAGLLGLRRSIDFLQLKNEDGLDVSAGSPVFIATSAASAFHIAAGQDLDVKEAIGMATSTIAVGATGDIQTRGILSLTTAQWDARTGQTGGLTIGSKYYLAVSPGDLSLVPQFDAARTVGVAIAADKMLLGFALVDDSRLYISGISARNGADNSIHGFQSVIDALSNRISAASVTSQEMSVRVQTASAAATSADAHANTVSARAVSISAELASLLASASAALRADITSVSAVIKADINSVSAAIRTDEASHIASTSATIKADINSVSAAIMADVASHLASASAAIMADAASHLASTSALIKTDINSVSAAIMADVASHLASTSVVLKADLTSVSAVIKTDINSVSAAIMSVFATSLLGAGQFRVVTGAQAVVSTFPQKVSGLSLSIAANGVYEIRGQILWTQSAAVTSASAIFQFGMSINQPPTTAAFRMMGNENVFGATPTTSARILFAGVGAVCATPSIMYSVKASVATSGAPVQTTMLFDGLLVAGGTGGLLKVLVGASTTSNTGINVIAGSFVRAFKIG